MAIESKVCSLGHPFRRLGNDVRFNQFSFAHANSGQSLRQTRDLPSLLRRSDTKLRAERVTRRPAPQEGWDNWQKTDRDDNSEEEGTSVWDSNAENIRRRRPPKKVSYYSRSEVEEALPPSMREGSNRSENGRWDYEETDGSGDGRAEYEATDRSGESSSRWNYGTTDRSGESSRWDYGTTERSGNRGRDRYERSDGSSGKNEWDYESEPSTAQTKPFWQRWFADKAGAVYEEEDEDYEEEEDNWLSWLSVDVKEAFLVLRWGLPAAFLLCTAVIPTLIGNPLILLFGFTIFPTVIKFLNPWVKDIFRSVESDPPTGSSKKRSQSNSAYSRRPQNSAKYDDFGSPSQPISRSDDFPSQQISRSDDFGSSPSQPMNRSYDADAGRPRVPARRSSLGGWDDLEDDRSRRPGESQWPLQRRGKSGKKLAKREQQPFVIRLILAFFPFLKGWAGLF